jgi:hypothetical protein
VSGVEFDGAEFDGVDVDGVDGDEPPLVAALAATAPPTTSPADTTPAASILCTERMGITSFLLRADVAGSVRPEAESAVNGALERAVNRGGCS